MNYQDQLYVIDHYDSWTYIIIGPLSLLASFCFIGITFFFKEARQFPGNLLIIISFSETVLCIHWILSGIYSPYITGYNIKNDSTFCKVNSHIALIAGSMQLTFQLSFLLSIIFQFRNTMKEIKYKIFFVVIPIGITIITWIFALFKKNLGKNIYGTCSVNNVENSGIIFGLINFGYLTLVGITLYVLRKYKQLSETRITIRDDFYFFYVYYAILTFLMYAFIGTNFFLDKYIINGLNGTKDQDKIDAYMRLFYITRLTNNLKIFTPFLTFLLRVNDPFIKKLINNFIKQKDSNNKTQDDSIMMNLSDSDSNDSMIYTDDFLINNQIRQIRMGIAKTMLKGIYDYYNQLIHEYKNITNESIINLLTYDIEESEQFSLENLDRNEQRISNVIDDKFFKCNMSSMHSLKFMKIIQCGNFGEFSNSFKVDNNKQAIEGSGESDGGKGGEFFLMTYDKKFFIKTINSEEEDVFNNIIQDYTLYFSHNNNSFITKILGYFIFDFKISTQKLKVVVLENVFKKRPGMISRKYDMKGSTFSRQVLKESLDIEQEIRISKTLKDIDFLNIDKEMNLSIEDGEFLTNQIYKDVEFFKFNKIIDYSLLLGVIELQDITNEQDLKIIDQLENEKRLFKDTKQQKAYMMGIIDYFQLYTYNKCFEKYTKKLIKFSINLDTSSQPPKFYAKRFKEFLNLIIKYQLQFQNMQILFQFFFKLIIN